MFFLSLFISFLIRYLIIHDDLLHLSFVLLCVYLLDWKVTANKELRGKKQVEDLVWESPEVQIYIYIYIYIYKDALGLFILSKSVLHIFSLYMLLCCWMKLLLCLALLFFKMQSFQHQHPPLQPDIFWWFHFPILI